MNYFLLVFINMETGEIFLSNSTAHPDSTWVTQQARNFLMHTSDGDDKPACLMRDRDTKFSAQFDDVLKAEGMKVKVLPVQSPKLTSRCEWVIQSIKQECLDNFLVFSERHLNYPVRKYVRYYNNDRAHSSCGHLPPTCANPPPENNTTVLDQIIRRERLGGLIHWYERAACFASVLGLDSCAHRARDTSRTRSLQGQLRLDTMISSDSPFNTS